MVPPAEFRSYYGRPLVKEPVWEALDVAGYLFLGGLAGASSALAAAKGPIAAILKLIVKIHEYFGKVMEEILHFLGPLQRMIGKAFKAVEEAPGLKPIINQLKKLFAEIEGAAASALGKLEKKAAAEGGELAARGVKAGEKAIAGEERRHPVRGALPGPGGAGAACLESGDVTAHEADTPCILATNRSAIEGVRTSP